MRLSVLIVDDEPHARRYIKNLLSKDSDIEVIYECRNGQEVLNFLKTKTPSIIFLDINMPGISGVEVAAKLKTTDSLIIFSTAYGEYALKAFEVKAFDYLLKPFENDRFYDVLEIAKQTVERFKQATFSEKFASLYSEYNNTLTPHLTEFVIKDKGFERKIHVDDILFIESSTVYVVLHLNGSKELYRVALNLLEQQLPHQFIRIHRSFIINTNYIKTTKYLNNSTYLITMVNDEIIISSRKYRDSISKRLS